jgi:hypothetical protein
MSAAQTLVLYLVIGLPLFYGLLKLADILPDVEYKIRNNQNNRKERNRTWTRH